MNLVDSWRLIGECMIPDSNAGVVAAAARDSRPTGMWHALFSERPRPLLLPVNNRRARRNGMRFFLPELWRKCYASLRLHAHDFLGERARLPLLTLPYTAAPTLTDELALTESPQLAFLIGTPGPYQKASILMMSPQGEPLALAKLALGAGANPMIAAEASWLRRLNEEPGIRDSVPRLLREGTTGNGQRYFAQSVVRGRSSSSTFTPLHAQFLRQLGAIDIRPCLFAHSPIAQRLRADMSRLAPLLTADHRQLLEGALAEINHRLGQWRGPFVPSHGDYAYWNIRAARDRICVFDWEYASTGTSPLFDPFHFHLIAPATSGRLLTARDMKNAVVTSRAFALLTYPEFEWRMSIVATHGLCYLLHTLLFYCLSRGQFVAAHPVVRSYSSLIAERAQWLQ